MLPKWCFIFATDNDTLNVLKTGGDNVKKRILIIAIAVIAVFVLFVPVFTYTARDGGSKIHVPLIPWMYYIDYHEISGVHDHNIKMHTFKDYPYAEKAESPEYTGGHGMGLFFGLFDITFDRYEVYKDGYKGKIKGFFESAPEVPDKEKIFKDIFETLDSGDREKTAKMFSSAAREAPGFEKELDAFLKAYPGNMSKMQPDSSFSEVLEPDHGRRLDNGVYALECYRSRAGNVNGRWYYIFISYLYYCASGEEYTGINKILILDESSRAVFNSNDTVKPFDHALCDIAPTGIDYRKIGGDYYIWISNPNTPIKMNDMLNALKRCKTIDDVVKALGTPNASEKGKVLKRYFYEGISEDGEPKYYCITENELLNDDKPSITCNTWTTEKRNGGSLYDSAKDYKEYPPDLKTPYEDTFTLTLNADYSISRDSHEGFGSLGWEVYRNGEHVLSRVAVRELTLEPRLQWLDGNTGTFTVYLSAWLDGGYKRVSNIIEYTLEEPVQTEAGTGMVMIVDGTKVPVIWDDNVSVMELRILAKNGMTLQMSAYGEKKHGANIGKVLDTHDDTINVSAGDIVLHSSNKIVICSGPGSGLYTRIGKIDLPEKEINRLFANKVVTITLKRG